MAMVVATLYHLLTLLLFYAYRWFGFFANRASGMVFVCVYCAPCKAEHEYLSHAEITIFRFLIFIYSNKHVLYTASVYRGLQGLCGEIRVRRFQIYGDCMYTRNPVNFDVNTLCGLLISTLDYDFFLKFPHNFWGGFQDTSNPHKI